jgi:hypothetical protein
VTGRFVGIAAVLAIAAQFVPVERSNPPVESDANAPASVKTILERSCYDCHSHTTVWPWYSHIAPVSWLVAHDVEEGREHLNFSKWQDHERSKKFAKLLDEVVEVVEEEEMPLWYYLPLHPEAALTQNERDAIAGWASGLRSGLPAPEAEAGDHH